MRTAEIFSFLVFLSGIGHFSLLAAMLQVPARLGWKEDLARVRPFNRKLMWVYGFFTLLTVMAFGLLDLALRGELVRGDRAAVALAIFIAIYWTARIAVDAAVFRHEDWPRGRGFVVGHVLLTALFVALAGTHLALALWHLVLRGGSA